MEFKDYLGKIDSEHAERMLKVIRTKGRDPALPTEEAEAILRKMCVDFILVARAAGLELVEKDDYK